MKYKIYANKYRDLIKVTHDSEMEHYNVSNLGRDVPEISNDSKGLSFKYLH